MTRRGRRTRRSYVDPNKDRWQRTAQLTAWDRLIGHVPVHLRKVVYLDTREAHQTIALLGHGYAPDRLLAVNAEAVELALLTRRLDAAGLPRVVTRTGDFVYEAASGLGAVDIVDFDGMSHCGGDVGDVELVNLVRATTPSVLTYTILCGRENEQGKSLIAAMRETERHDRVPSHDSLGHAVTNQNHWRRLKAVALNATGYARHGAACCVSHVRAFAWGVYLSTSKQPMAWMALRLVPHRQDTVPAVQSVTTAISAAPPEERAAFAGAAVRALLEAKARNTADPKVDSYGLSPLCLKWLAWGPRAWGEESLKDDVPLPDWSSEQALAQGFAVSEADRPWYRGWPRRPSRREVTR